MPSGMVQGEKLLQMLVEKNILTNDQRQAVLSDTKTNQDVFNAILKKNFLTERDLTVFLGQEFNIPLVNPLTYVVAKEVLTIVPTEFAKKHRLIPLTCLNHTLTVATSNPLDLLVWDDLSVLTGYKIRPVLATPSAIDESIRKFYIADQADPKAGEQSMADIVKSLDNSQTIEHIGKGQAMDLASGPGDDTPIIKIANLLVMESIKRGASDLFIEPWEKHMRIRCRVDGSLEEIKSLPVSMSQQIISRLKVMSKLDIAEHRIPQDGRFKAKIQNREVDFRVSIIPTSFGEKICIRLLDKKSQSQDLEALGFTEDETKKIRSAASKPHGMLLVTGPTGSGKTTTLYSVLNYLHVPDRNITTVEDPVEYQIAGINQVAVREAVGLTFAAALRSILRQDPNVIMIGEIRDLETMDTAIKAALTGHLVLSTLHTNDAPSSVVRMVNMGVEPFLIASSVHLVTAQRLIRRLCVNCKEQVTPTDETLKVLKWDRSKPLRIFKPHGCNSCRNTGFAGRRVITEVMAMSPALQELVLKRATGDQVKKLARQEGMRTLRESGMHKVITGETTVEEVLKITATDQEL